jgi:hypothetical protein
MPSISKYERTEREALLLRGFKPCSSCGEAKPTDQFNIRRTKAWDGLDSQCKPCKGRSNRAAYTRNQ